MADPKDVMQLDPTAFKENLWVPVSDTDIPAGPGKESLRIDLSDVRPKIIAWDVTTNAIPGTAKPGDFLNVTVGGAYQGVTYTTEEGAQVISLTGPVLRPMKKSSPPVKGDWDVTPTPELVIGVADTLYATFANDTLTTDWTGSTPGGLGVAVVKTDVDLDVLVPGQSRRFGMQITQVPTGNTDLVMVGLAPAAMSASDIAVALQTLFAQQPVAAPIFIFYAGNISGSPGTSGMFVLENDINTNTRSISFVNGAAIDADAFVVNDKIQVLFNRQTASGPTRDMMSLGAAFIRNSDNAYDLAHVNWVDDNPVFPTGMTLYYAVVSLDTGGGYSNLTVKADLTSAPTSYAIAGTSFGVTNNDADWALRYPNPILSLQTYTQAEFPVDAQVNEMYRSFVSNLYNGPTPTPYGVPVSNKQYLVIENVTPTTEAFTVLTDTDMVGLAVSESGTLTADQITAASRRAGEMVFYVQDPDYTDPTAFSGGATYVDFDTAYDAAILNPKWIPKIMIIEDRAGLWVDEPAGGRVYDLIANNIWIATYSRWAAEPAQFGGSSIRWRARCDGLMFYHCNIELASSSFTAGPLFTLGPVMSPFGSVPNLYGGSESTLAIVDSSAFDSTNGGAIKLGDNSVLDCPITLTSNFAQIEITMGQNASINLQPVSCGGPGYVYVYIPRNYANLNIIDINTQSGNVILQFISDLGYQALLTAITPTSLGLGNVDNTADADKPISTDVSNALSGKQPASVALSDIAGLNPTAGDILQFLSGVWTNRTPSQYKVNLSLVKGDVGLGNVDNTSDADKPISDAVSTALGGKQASAQDLTDIAALTPSNDDILQRKAGVWTNRTPSQFKTDLALAKADVGLSNVDNTSDADKPISDATSTALGNKQAADQDLTDISALTPSNDDFLQRKAGAWANRTIAQVKADLNDYDVVDLQASTAFTITAAHANKLLLVGGAGAVTITIPENATENLPKIVVGFATQNTDIITFIKEGTDVLIAKDNFVSMDGVGSVAVYFKLASGLHLIAGDLS